jgi:hypothetical protein
MTFDEIVKADLEIDEIVLYQASNILRSENLPLLPLSVLKSAAKGDIPAARLVVRAHRARQSRQLQTRLEPYRSSLSRA